MRIVDTNLTVKQRNKILEKYELDAKDIRLLERKGINSARTIIREIQRRFPQYEYNGLTVYSQCYQDWKKEKAPAVTSAK